MFCVLGLLVFRSAADNRFNLNSREVSDEDNFEFFRQEHSQNFSSEYGDSQKFS